MSNLNLIPIPLLRARTGRRHLRAWGTAIGVSLCALALPLVLDWANRAKAGELESLSGDLGSQLQALRVTFREITSETTRVQGQIERARALRSKRTWSALLGVMGSCLPESAWLTSIATDPPAPAAGRTPGRTLGGRRPASEEAPETVTIDAPRRLKITGYVLDHEQLYEFMRRMKQTEVFSEVTLIRSGVERYGKGAAVGFEVICEW